MRKETKLFRILSSMTVFLQWTSAESMTVIGGTHIKHAYLNAMRKKKVPACEFHRK